MQRGLLTAVAVMASIGATQTAQAARPTWTQADKHGFGTSFDSKSRVWFTLRQRELTEVFWPDLGTPAIRDLQFVVTDGRTFIARESSPTTTGTVQISDARSLSYRQVVQDRRKRWRITKTFVTDPRRSAVLASVRFESLTGKPLRLFALVDPALSNTHTNDRARSSGRALTAWDRKGASALRSLPAFTRTTSGYGRTRSDPWRVLRRNGGIDRERSATRRRGDVRQAARIPLTGLSGSQDATIALAFAKRPKRAAAVAADALRTNFAATKAAYDGGWHAYLDSLPAAPASLPADLRPLYDRSLMVMRASEDKAHPGAGVASPTMPWAWGRLTIEHPSAPYHLVWARDLYQVGTAQLAAGDVGAANRALDYLFATQQKRDGSFPQNSEVDGTPHWTNLQLDEVAFPIVLAHQLGRNDRYSDVKRAADFIARTGPRTRQERWENQSGWSPATIAAEIAGLVCAADMARRAGDTAAAARWLRTADLWQADVERWTATRTGPYSPRPYYLRLTKGRDPDRGTRYKIGDGGPAKADQRRVVDPSFLELVRLGVKRWDDPAILNTVAVVDGTLKVETPNGPFWHRFTYDGYGERRDGGPWDLSPDDSLRTLGRVWPIFTGERGEYELLAGRDGQPSLRAMANAANDGLMLPEQVWDGRPPTGRNGLAAGEGTFSATPLAWTHAQFVRLAWSIDAGRPVERPAVVACRYGAGAPLSCP
jgi:glucoamylase